MAIKSRGFSSDGKRIMSLEEFKQWLKKFDRNKDGRISRAELKEAISFTGGHFATWKSWRGLRSVDSNDNGFIDDNEISHLFEFAQKHLGIRIIDF